MKGDLTPKEISRRIKASGLQKLRWYCQMCQKQCRDENGFRNHCSSESHLRQMKLFALDKEKFIGSYSELFEQGFVDTLKNRHGTARIKANTVYQEYIADRHHVHMNATTWLTLGNFVKYLGRSGICVVEQTPKGWYITYIDRDPAKAQREAEKQRNEQNDLDASERWQQQMEKQLDFIRTHLEIEDYQATELQRADGDEPLRFNWKSNNLPKHVFDLDAEGDGEDEEDMPGDEASPKAKPEDRLPIKAEPKEDPAEGDARKPKTKINFSQMVQNARDVGPRAPATEGPNAKKLKTDSLNSLGRIMQQDLRKKEAKGRREDWLHTGIVVKVLNKKVGDGKYYKQKGVVIEVIDRYLGKVQMLDFPGAIKVDQEELETVVPQLGGKVMIVNGAYRGEVGTLQAVNMDKFYADIQIVQGTRRGILAQGLDYEDFSKLHVDEP